TMLQDNCTTDLANALDHVAHGDLTVEVVPVTPELERSSNDEIGDVAEAVGKIRNNTVASVVAYNAMREQLNETMAQLADTADRPQRAHRRHRRHDHGPGRADEPARPERSDRSGPGRD